MSKIVRAVRRKRYYRQTRSTEAARPRKMPHAVRLTFSWRFQQQVLPAITIHSGNSRTWSIKLRVECSLCYTWSSTFPESLKRKGQQSLTSQIYQNNKYILQFFASFFQGLKNCSFCPSVEFLRAQGSQSGMSVATYSGRLVVARSFIRQQQCSSAQLLNWHVVYLGYSTFTLGY